MIRAIVAIDAKRGIADDHGIPWQGKIPSDVKYYRSKVKDGIAVMGYGLYLELSKPYPGVKNYVAMGNIKEQLREGFIAIHGDAHKFIEECSEDVWNLGGAGLFSSTFDLNQEVYITQLNRDFHCTKFFPETKDKFDLVEESEPLTENEITFTFQKWQKK